MDDHLTLTLMLDRAQIGELGRILCATLGGIPAPAAPPTPISGQDRLLTVPEVCDLLGVSRNTVYGWRYQRVGPPSIQIGRNLRYRRSDITRWLDGQASSCQSPTG
jgi:excisionase family DNA binding protein